MVKDRDPAATISVLERARAHQANHDFASAEALYRSILSREPRDIRALRGLATLVARAGRMGEAAVLLEAALDASSPEERAVVLEALATARRRLGEAGEALRHYRAAARLQPQSFSAAMNLGAAFADAGALGDAVEAFSVAVRLQPASSSPLQALARVLNRLGRHAEALSASRRGLEIAPGDAQLFRSLAHALKELGRLEEAAATLQERLRLDASDLDALFELGLVFKDGGRTAEAVACFRRLVAAAPDYAAARISLCVAHLPPLCADEAERLASRSAYAAELRALACWARRSPPAALAPGVGSSQPFYLPYQGENDAGLQAEYGAISTRAMAAAYAPQQLPRYDGRERVRIGVVCGHIRDHSVWRMPTRGWVETLDRTRFEVFGYHTSPLTDATTAAAVSAFDRFTQGPLTLEQWRDKLAADRPHVLIYPEIGMDPMVARLAAQRLAPVQCASWGHPVTSGLSTIDAFLSCDAMEPNDAQGSYTERLIRLPGLSSPCRLPEPPPAGTVGGGRRSRRHPPSFWCAQSPQKYLPAHDPIFPRIAEAVGECRFVFSAFPGSDALTERFRRRLQTAFEAQGLDALRYCRILPRLEPDRYRARMARSDVFLDSIGWSGCNSLMEALACGLPVVSLEGDSLRARHGAAILRLCGFGHLVCRNEDEYVAAARTAALAGATRPRSADRTRLSRLLADAAGTRALEDELVAALKATTRL